MHFSNTIITALFSLNFLLEPCSSTSASSEVAGEHQNEFKGTIFKLQDMLEDFEPIHVLKKRQLVFTTPKADTSSTKETKINNPKKKKTSSKKQKKGKEHIRKNSKFMDKENLKEKEKPKKKEINGTRTTASTKGNKKIGKNHKYRNHKNN